MAIVVATVPRLARPVDAAGVTVTATRGSAHQGRRRRALWRLDPRDTTPQRPHPRARRPAGACRERVLADFDVRADDMVRRLRIAGMIAPSATWTSRDEDAARA